jgi:Bifunctional DNA primase/polymerase, N-terminal
VDHNTTGLSSQALHGVGNQSTGNHSVTKYAISGSKDQAKQGVEGMNPFLKLPLLYAHRGWPVFPIHTPTTGGCSCRKPGCTNIGKHPRTAHGHTDATTEAASIRQWWNEVP